jgi:hypothetical protein
MLRTSTLNTLISYLSEENKLFGIGKYLQLYSPFYLYEILPTFNIL